VGVLESMGFSREDALSALDRTNGDTAEAAALLSEEIV
jgi:NACalpha-BTF3-like transcription factor